VSHHGAGFRAVDYYGLKKPIRVATFIEQAVYMTILCLITDCIQIQNKRHIGPYVFSYQPVATEV